jgi:hypothetical protein
VACDYRSSFSFAIAVLIVGGIFYFFTRWHYKALLARKDGELTQKDEQLKTLRLANEQYREHLHLQPPAKSRYTRMTNAELQHEALETVQQIRPHLEQHKRDEYLHNGSPYPRDASEEIKNQLFHRQFRETVQRDSHFMANYNERFLADVILLRNEINKRLPHSEKEPHSCYIEKLSEKPISPRDVGIIVLDLERLAKRLPVST